MRHLPGLAAALVVAAWVPACGQATGASQEESYYFVSYVDAEVYAKDEDVLDECSDSPGTSPGGGDSSYPPSDSLIFTGDEVEQRGLEDCLKRLPNVRVLGPARKGETAPPVLVGP